MREEEICMEEGKKGLWGVEKQVETRDFVSYIINIV